VADALAIYQNPDGGMGRALEPDIRLADSSVRVCTIALQVLARYRFTQPSDLLDGVSRFLVSAYDDTTAAWAAVPPNVSDAPHAPWWNYRPPSDCLINPRPEILGYLCRWPGFVPGPDIERISTEIGEHLKTAEEVEMHDLMCFDLLFASPHLPSALDSLKDRYFDLARRTIPVNDRAWKGYTLTPLSIIDDPSHPLAEEFAGPIQRNLEYLRSQQTADGSWDPTWDWGDDPEWAKVEKDVRSRVTARAIRLLQRFNAFR
jgi:hypothetical protein